MVYSQLEYRERIVFTHTDTLIVASVNINISYKQETIKMAFYLEIILSTVEGTRQQPFSITIALLSIKRHLIEGERNRHLVTN